MGRIMSYGKMSEARISTCTRWVAGSFVGLALAGWLSAGRLESGDRNRRRCEPRATADETLRERPSAVAVRQPLDGAIKFAQDRQGALRDIHDYTAVFKKIEMVGTRLVRQTMDMKFRREPFSVYFHCRSKLDPCREVIFAEGANDGNLLVHEAGLKSIIGTLSLKPDDSRVMEENRYPITMAGMAKMLEVAIAIWESEKDIDPADVAVEFDRACRLDEVECEAIRVTHPRELPGLKFHQNRIWFDRQTRLPVRVEQYGWPSAAGEKPPLVEQYAYTEIRTNVGLTAVDFDPRNSEYRFAVARLRDD